jgi:energy-coupling factor transporter ATP-binding protein EcfA2
MQDGQTEYFYYSSVELRNVRGFGEEGLSIDFKDGSGRPAMWTLLLGENGTGKTTVLQALAGLGVRDAFADRYDELSQISGSRVIQMMLGGLFRGPKEPAAITAEIERSRNSEVALEPLGVEVLEPVHDPEYSFRFVLHVSGENPRHWPKAHVIGYPAYRGGTTPSPEPGEGIYGPLVGATDLLWTSRDSLADVESWLQDLRLVKLEADERLVETDYDRVLGLLQRVLPGVKEIRHRLTEEKNRKVVFEFETPDGWVRYRDLALGYRAVTELVVDIAFNLFEAREGDENPLERPAIVLIDEIDQHLHPKWQRQLAQMLTQLFPRVQFIVSAHSPLMVQASAGHNIVVLKRHPETGGIVAYNDVDEIATWRLDQIVTSELFDVPTARGPEFDELIARKDALLAQDELLDEEREELESIDRRLGEVPSSDSHDGRLSELLLERLNRLEGDGKD